MAICAALPSTGALKNNLMPLPLIAHLKGLNGSGRRATDHFSIHAQSCSVAIERACAASSAGSGIDPTAYRLVNCFALVDSFGLL